MLPDIVSYIKRRLLADWSDINFIIGTNPEDYIELRFTLSSIDAPSGLKAYMGTLVDSDPEMISFQLRRVAQYWGLMSNKRKNKRDLNSSDLPEESDDEESMMHMRTADEEYVYYMLAPLWARQKEPILYLQQFNNNNN